MSSLNNGGAGKKFVRRNEKLKPSTDISIGGALDILRSHLNLKDERPTIPLGHGDPSPFACFRTTHVADDALSNAVKSAKFNSYVPVGGILPARRSVAEYLSRDLPYKLSAEDVFLTSGCRQAIEVIVSVLSYPGANILIPKPGYPHYDGCASANNLEIRHFDLLHEKAWEIDLEAVEALSDQNTVAIVVINPGNPCGNVYTYDHLKKWCNVFKLHIRWLKLQNEGLGKPPMGVFGSTVPVFTLDWLVPESFLPRKQIIVERKYVFLCGSLFLKDITDDLDFCIKLAKEESVIILPGVVLGLKNWLRITFSIDIPSLKDALRRIKSFCDRHAKSQNNDAEQVEDSFQQVSFNVESRVNTKVQRYLNYLFHCHPMCGLPN
ncbi:hypothetical protein MKX03_019709 [Papaver bracteatum]|nr:hypothetical protein MKX03_019709 [Papaver bracteatum]